MPLLALSPIVSVKVKHLWKKPTSPLLYYRRRIPDDVKPLLEASGSEWAGKAQIAISLQTDDPKAAVPKIAKLALCYFHLVCTFSGYLLTFSP